MEYLKLPDDMLIVIREFAPQDIWKTLQRYADARDKGTENETDVCDSTRDRNLIILQHMISLKGRMSHPDMYKVEVQLKMIPVARASHTSVEQAMETWVCDKTCPIGCTLEMDGNKFIYLLPVKR
eukprot:29871-Eustigmatos_ZCMA.PRE.1